ncbi:hypothetical protein GQ457_09G010480 [Hibiscus cannabinus]
MNQQLCKKVTKEEMKEAVFSMGALKSLGPDGFPGLFYHSFWELIKDDLFILVESSSTMVFLNPVLTKQIFMCNFSLKVITKILASRLKPLLPDIIPYSQSAFVSGRLIQDNIIIAHEAFHAIKRRKRTKNAAMAIKIDMEKAYDKVDWEFNPTRGLRQGDPLSPFLFLLISNIFSWILDREIADGHYEGFKIKRTCPTVKI